jgi:hypothetical protein
MKLTVAAIAVSLVLIPGAAPASAQALPYGAWSGTMTPPPRPDGQPSAPIPVSYEVGEVDGALTVVMRALLVQEIIRFNDVRLDGDDLKFWWEPGIRVDCTLHRTSIGGYQGPCAAGTGSAGEMSMIPPPPRS